MAREVLADRTHVYHGTPLAVIFRALTQHRQHLMMLHPAKSYRNCWRCSVGPTPSETGIRSVLTLSVSQMVRRMAQGRGSRRPAFAVDRFLLLMLAGVLSIVPLCDLDVSPVPGEDCPARFRSAIGAHEVPIAFTWARIPRSQSPGLSFLGIRVVVEVVDLVRSRLALNTIRERSENLGFPLDRKMAMLATSRRLLIWQASRHGLRAPKLLGAVARDHIASARLPFVGGGWRVVEVNLVDGSGVRFLAHGRYAQQFADVLRGHG